MKKILTLVTLASVPYIAYGAVVRAPNTFKDFIDLIIGIMGQLIVVIFALTILAFMWGVIKGWVIKGGSEAGVEEGKNVVKVTIIALVVMISFWGILSLLQKSLFEGASPQAPTQDSGEQKFPQTTST